jgi:hypothetical protein
MKKLLSIALAIMFLTLNACKKDGPAPTLVGKWKIATVILKAGTTSTTYTGTSTDYADFKVTGKVELSLMDKLTETPYTIAANTVTIDDQIFEIRNLSAGSASLYFSTVLEGIKIEETINLIK